MAMRITPSMGVALRTGSRDVFVLTARACGGDLGTLGVIDDGDAPAPTQDATL